MALLLLVFAVTLALTAGTYWLVNSTLEGRETARVRDRLAGKDRAQAAAQQAPGVPLFVPDGESARPWWARLSRRLSVDAALQNLLDQAGVSTAPGQIALYCLLFALVTVNLMWYLAPSELRKLAFLIGPAAGAIPIFVLRRKRAKRMAKIESQFPDALQFVARAMRAGHAFSVSLDMLHKEFAEPLKSEFRRTFEEQNLGLPMDTALDKLARRVPLLDVRFFVAAVILQKRTGGNLGEVLDSLASLIRERFKLRGQIRSISAHGRLSSLVLTAIPVVVAIMMYFVNLKHMMFFVEEEIGQWMAMAAVGLIVLGFLIMRQIVNIEV
jgi:tight adherence protein B